jgi:hypothetical protein
LSRGSIPNALNIAGSKPRPTPRIARPPESWSSVATSAATRSGSWIEINSDVVPRRTRRVIAASAASATSGDAVAPGRR